MMHWGNAMGGWGMLLMTASSLIFWGLVIAGFVVLVRNLGSGRQAGAPTGQPPTPQQILADRFARGEIDEDDYARRLRVLHPGG
jgi:putative membrane protein